MRCLWAPGAKALIGQFAVASHHCDIPPFSHRCIHIASMLILLSLSLEVVATLYPKPSCDEAAPSSSTTRPFPRPWSETSWKSSRQKPVPHWRRKNSRMKCRSLALQGPRARTQRLPVGLQVLDIASSWYFLYARCETRLRLHGAHRFCTKACDANCATSLLPVM